MKDVFFNPSGDRLQVGVRFGYPHFASYELLVWESGSNTIVMQRRGNNQNPDDDDYLMPLPNSNNNGRLVECICTILNPNLSNGDRYSVTLIVKQGETEIGNLNIDEPMNAPYVYPDLVIRLIATK